MSTFTDGAPPSVAPEPGDSGPDNGHRAEADAVEPPSDWLQEEIKRRIAAKSSGSGGRHARRDGAAITNGLANGHGNSNRRAVPGQPAPLPRLPRPAGPADEAWSGAPRPAPERPAPERPASERQAPQRPAPQPVDRAAHPVAERPAPERPAVERPLTPAPTRPAPPSGSAAARLLSPPRSSTPPAASPPAASPPAASTGAPTTAPPATAPPSTAQPTTPMQPTGPHRVGAPPQGPAATPAAPAQPAAAQTAAQPTAAPPAPPSPQPAAAQAPPTGPPPGHQPLQIQRQQQHPPQFPRARPGGAQIPSLKGLLPTGPLVVPDVSGGAPGAPPSYAQQTYSQPSLFTPHDPDAQSDDPAGEVIWSAVTATAPYPPVTTPPPGAVSVPEQRTSAPGALEGSPADRLDDDADDDRDDEELNNKRVRVVLAERKGVARPVRTVVDIQEGTGVGELLRSNLIGSQLTVALRFAVGAGITLGVLPLLFALVPEIGKISILGIRLPWLLLGFLVYPFLLGMGWWHTRTAERVEQNFADHVQD